MEKVLEDTIGLDIRNSALTAVELAVTKDGFKVVNYSRVDLEPGIIDEDSILLNPEEFKEAVKKLLKEGHEGEIKSRNVIISIAEEKTFSHYLNVPVQDADCHEDILEYAKDLIPIELSEAAIDYKRLEQKSDKKTVGFNFAAVQKSIIQPIINTLQESDIRVVAIDVDKNSLMRVCTTCVKEKTDTMLIEVNYERSLLTVKNNCGLSHTLTLSMGEKMLIERIKEDLKIESVAKVKSMIRGVATGKDEASQKIQGHIKDFFDTLIKRSKELHKMVQDEGCPNIDTFFVVETGLKWPGLKDALKKAFPKSEIIDKFECIKIGDEDQRFYFNAIGLGLRAILPNAHAQDINLLPHVKKEELHASNVRPKLRLGFLSIFLLISAILIYSSLATARTYFDYLVGQKELAFTAEKISNPYLAQAAQSNQQKAQLGNQIKTILSDSIPISWIVEKIDSYNLNGIGLVNVGYKLNLDGTMSMHIRAKTVSRDETEKFIIKLDSDPTFLQVNSPLSNLVGKGERFIQIDLVLNRENFPSNVDEPVDTEGEDTDPRPTDEHQEDEQPDDTAEPEGDDVETDRGPSTEEETTEPLEEEAEPITQ